MKTSAEQRLTKFKVVKQVLENPEMSKSSVCKEVLLDVLISQNEQISQTDSPADNHEFEAPSAFITGLISGHFPLL